MTAITSTLTDCGDLAVILPLVVVIEIWLLAMRRPAAALWWVCAVGLCMGGTAILKIYFYICPPVNDLRSPSGHTSVSVLVYGTLTLAIAMEIRGWRRYLILGLGSCFVLAIAISRVLVQAHSVLEVITGLMIGAGALTLYTHAYRRNRPSGRSLRPLIATSAVLMILLNGQELHAEDFLHSLGIYISSAGLVCP
jgi:undecaprenyl-diphosphatase